METVTAACISSGIDMENLSAYLQVHHQPRHYRGAVTCNYQSGFVVFFEFGCLVSWGGSPDGYDGLMKLITPYLSDVLPEPIIDEFTADEDTVAGVKNDHIRLANCNELERLAYSFALAQSVKLDQFEKKADFTIEDTYHIPRRIAETGDSGLSRQKIAQLRGRLFVAQADINLKFDLLDTPEFFWEYPELEDRYRMTSNYLDVNHRIDVLNKRLQVIHGILEMLAEERNHGHSATLEWIIIWLITFEVAIFFLHDIFKVF